MSHRSLTSFPLVRVSRAVHPLDKDAKLQQLLATGNPFRQPADLPMTHKPCR